TQFFYIIFYKFALKATEMVGPNQPEANYGNLELHTKDVGMTEDIYEMIYELSNQIIIKLENTFIIKDGQDKTFEPARKHTHEYEHKLFCKFLKFIKITVENLKKNPQTILKISYFLKFAKYNYIIYVNPENVEPYLLTWITNSMNA
ncbi:hypothetical protein COBT_003054, partial [Conglomerata obtusa]